MTEEDEEFNRIEREAKLRMEAVSAALDKKAENARELGLDYEPAQQEPVAFLVDDDLYYPEEIDWESLKEQGHTVFPLYTSPPAQRTWVGLSEEERRSIREWQRIQEELGPVWSPMMLYLYEAIEAKLRSKNEDRN